MVVKLSSKSSANEKPSVPILDDEKKICSVRKTFLILSELFKNVVVAHSVSMALMKIGNEKIDLVIVDYNLPDKKGTDFIDTIKKTHSKNKIHFLLISGYLNNKALSEIINLGVSQVLVKPFTRAMLIKKVCEILKCPVP